MIECPHCTEEVNYLSDHYNTDGWTCEGLSAAPCSAAELSLDAADKALWAALAALDLANPSRRKRHRVAKHISDSLLSLGQAKGRLKSMKQNTQNPDVP